MTVDQQRLDVWLVENGRAETRSRAQALIMAGKVVVNDRVETKSGRGISSHDRVDVTQSLPYVSRGGLKLEGALKAFTLDPTGWTVVDVGASTGGFTDCWLQHGAGRVYAVDVGYGQLDWRLRQDPRVVVLERTNARYLTPEPFSERIPLDGASIDASFIGLKLLLPPLLPLLGAHASLVALVKPQFEAGRGQVGKGGVVRDVGVHERVLKRVTSDARALGYSVCGLAQSPIKGSQGNIEFLMHLGTDPQSNVQVDIPAVVASAWEEADERGG